MTHNPSAQTLLGKNLVYCLCISFSIPVFVAQQAAYAQTPTIDVKLVPIRSDNTNDIVFGTTNKIFTTAGSRVWFEIYYSNWAPELLMGVQFTVDANLFSNGIGEPIAPAFETCTTDSDCENAFDPGGTCTLSGPFPGPPPNLYGENTCRPGFITEGRDDDIPFANGGPFFISDARTANAFISFGQAKILDAPKSDPGFDVYGGTLVMDVPEGASGIYTLNFTSSTEPDSNASTAFVNRPGDNLEVNIQSTPAMIVLGGNICCDFNKDCIDTDFDVCIGGIITTGHCDSDCNANGTSDICELAWFVQDDCNGNGQLDECDIAEDPTLDCNYNNLLDECDIASDRSDDCNGNNIPDDCEGLLTLGADCNGNGVLDECDIADEFSFDEDLNCVPDECDIEIAPLAEPIPHPKSRYISFVPTNTGCNTVVRVTLSNLPDFPSFAEQYRWVGPPQKYFDTLSSNLMFTAAKLQCEPYYMDWSTVGLVHVYGPAIVPGSEYEVQQFMDTICIPEVDCYTNPLVVQTGKWGDVIAPFDDGSEPQQPNIADVLAIVDKWLGSPDPLKTQAQLQPHIIDPTVGAGIADILKCVDAWLGVSYPYSGPNTCGP